MLKKEDIEYIKQAIVTYSIKFREEIPEGSYRWCLFVYSNVLELVPIDNYIKELAKKIINKLKPEHKLNWVRHNITELRKDKIPELEENIDRFIDESTNFTDFKILLFLKYCLESKYYLVDDYMLDKCSIISKYERCAL